MKCCCSKKNIRGRSHHVLCRAVVGVFAAALLFAPPTAHAYIGPGAGFAFIGSSFVFVLTSLLALVTLCAWPFLWLLRKYRRRGLNPRAKRVVIVGLDGLDATLTERMIKEQRLPNLAALQAEGGYRRLATTVPALSPVAWSTFQTGVNPGAHNIFDFLSRDKRHYVPMLGSTETIAGKVITFLGRKFQVGSARVTLTRKSQPFWKLLSKHGVFSNILRVPISYPPEKFNGTILSAMCTPDVRGTQGTFSFFSTRPKEAGKVTGGEHKQLTPDKEGWFCAEIAGPHAGKAGQPLTAPLRIRSLDANSAELEVQGEKLRLEKDLLSPWVKVTFRLGARKRVHAMARFCLREAGSEISLYATPLNVDPEKPSIPIAHPIYFASWLAKRIGPFSTLGFAEDTWGRNEYALNDQIFLEQAYLTHAEREQMFFEALRRTREGVLACVFDATDRIQHMFWRYIDDKHPSPLEDRARFGGVIEELYERMDDMVGRIRAKLNPGDALVVLSDHGFGSFRRGINLNTWLKNEGYLVLREGKDGSSDYLADVDWSKTRAYCLGLSGIYLNRKGRELHGIVTQEQAAPLIEEIGTKLKALRDPQDGSPCVRSVYSAEKVYRGLYKGEAPDLIPGNEPGYRVSWDAVTGTLEPEVFSDNIKAWSGDHHIDPSLVPGVLFSNRPITKEKPHMLDLAPSVLDLFGLKAPKYMEGGVIFN